jgi:hypothetical protein
LLAIRSKESIRLTAKTLANLGRPQIFSKGAVFPVIDSNNYSFSYVTDLSSSLKLALISEIASLPVKTKLSSSSIVRKGAIASLP